MIEFKDDNQVGGAAIVVWRVEGNTLAYRLKEALLMHSFLDELQSILDDPEADEVGLLLPGQSLSKHWSSLLASWRFLNLALAWA